MNKKAYIKRLIKGAMPAWVRKGSPDTQRRVAKLLNKIRSVSHVMLNKGENNAESKVYKTIAPWGEEVTKLVMDPISDPRRTLAVANSKRFKNMFLPTRALRPISRETPPFKKLLKEIADRGGQLFTETEKGQEFVKRRIAELAAATPRKPKPYAILAQPYVAPFPENEPAFDTVFKFIDRFNKNKYAKRFGLGDIRRSNIRIGPNGKPQIIDFSLQNIANDPEAKLMLEQLTAQSAEL